LAQIGLIDRFGLNRTAAPAACTVPQPFRSADRSIGQVYAMSECGRRIFHPLVASLPAEINIGSHAAAHSWRPLGGRIGSRVAD